MTRERLCRCVDRDCIDREIYTEKERDGGAGRESGRDYATRAQ